jgi:hypothetical protein
MYTCRQCERPINQASELCPYCGDDLTVPVEEEAASKPAAMGRKAVIRRWVLWGVIVAGMWLFLWFVLPERPGAATSEAEQRAVEGLREVASALAEFQTSSGRFPDSLDALTGESLIRARAAAQRAQAMGYRLEYTPGPREPDGTVRTYVMLARPGNFGYRNFYAGERGTIHWTRENRPATAQDKPI